MLLTLSAAAFESLTSRAYDCSSYPCQCRCSSPDDDALPVLRAVIFLLCTWDSGMPGQHLWPAVGQLWSFQI